jgi:PAS domain S-box-containing protein
MERMECQMFEATVSSSPNEYIEGALSAQILQPGESFAGAIIKAIPGLIGYWGRDLRCRFANDAYKEWFGARPEPIIGTTLQDLLGARAFALNEPYIHGVLTGKAQHFERVHSVPDGRVIHALANYIPDVVDGQVVGFIAVIGDVTGLKNAEVALRAEMEAREIVNAALTEKEKMLRVAQALCRIGSWEWHVAADVVIWSEEMYRIWGLSTAQRPPNFAEHGTLYVPNSLDRLRQAVSTILQDGEPYSLELEFIRPDGSHGWGEGRGEAVRDPSGIVSKLCGTFQDITDRRSSENARRESDDRWRLIAESTSDIITQLDLGLVRRYVSPACRATLGYEPEEMIGVTPF